MSTQIHKLPSMLITKKGFLSCDFVADKTLLMLLIAHPEASKNTFFNFVFLFIFSENLQEDYFKSDGSNWRH